MNRFACLTAAVLMSAATSLAADSGTRQPLKVFILAGQSNMQGHAHIRTFEHIGLDPKTVPMLKEMQDAEGNPRICKDVWISSIGSSDSEKSGRLTAGFGAEAKGPKIGPEFTFGLYAQKKLKQPILIIKTAWGGKSIHTDFRPPSAGAYKFNENQVAQLKKQGKDLDEAKAARAKVTGHYYRLMTQHVHKVLSDIKRVYPEYDEQQGYELAGLVWFQGWNDMVDRGVYPNRDKSGGYDDYSKVLTHFIRDVRKDLKAPQLPFVIGVMGAGGPISKYTPDQKRYAAIHQNFRDAMAGPAKLPEFKGNVTAVLTENYWDNELHQLRYRDSRIKRAVNAMQKAGDITKQEAAEMQKSLRMKKFTERELRVLSTATSNFEFHYLGCAKILAGIGKGFAEAVCEMQK